ncbi:tRNA pseudouridine synthase-like 1 [Uranotaenia lowii]|uniref:tRNA pseudouridine synthase-like 1 n=1 Tax=Uranotaenia lowii TaxID=190385 RepID=UPI0024785FA9|nr:tRNA pseudouridine synthase-like 1 [Uranotaenia lowii]
MNRYLIHLSYIGTQFRGIQKNVYFKGNELVNPVDYNSVEGLLEIALKKFDPINEFKIKISSRTDAGVHALHNTVHVDLERRNGRTYPEEKMTQKLNRSLGGQGLPIRVLKTQLVPMTFHARLCAKSRTYLYRLGALRPEHCDKYQNQPFSRFIPIEEHDRCYFIAHRDFNIDRLRRVAKMFEGYHDFRTFMATSRGNSRQIHASHTLRTIESICIEPGQSMVSLFHKRSAEYFYDYWDIQIRAKSFLYNQVRRMVGSWIAAAEGRISERDIYQMLTVPSKQTWCDKAVVAPASALFLCKVEYDPADLAFPVDSDELPRAIETGENVPTADGNHRYLHGRQ